MSVENGKGFYRIKNWEKFQPQLKNGKGKRPWIRLDCNLEDDREYQGLSMFNRGLLVSLWRLRGRIGKDIPADPRYIARALSVNDARGRCQTSAVSLSLVCLTSAGFLTLCNQQGLEQQDRTDKTDKTGRTQAGEKPGPSAPPAREPQKFIVPSEVEVSAYMAEQGFQNPDQRAKGFIDYYEVRGWIPSGSKTQMKNWKAAVRSWKGRENGNGTGQWVSKAQQREIDNVHAAQGALRRTAGRDC